MEGRGLRSIIAFVLVLAACGASPAEAQCAALGELQEIDSRFSEGDIAEALEGQDIDRLREELGSAGDAAAAVNDGLGEAGDDVTRLLAGAAVGLASGADLLDAAFTSEPPSEQDMEAAFDDLEQARDDLREAEDALEDVCSAG